METRPAPAEMQSSVREAACLIRAAHHLTAFTGAGISVESGISPFRGPGRVMEPMQSDTSYPTLTWHIL